MEETTEPSSEKKQQWKEYCKQFDIQRKEDWKWKSKAIKAGEFEVKDFLVGPQGVDMKSFCGTEIELAYAIEQLYSNNGRDFDPSYYYMPSMLSAYGKDYAMHARGIYYRDFMSDNFTNLVPDTHRVWEPTLPEVDSNSPDLHDLQDRAEIFATKCQRNENWCKSEFAWEADAWSDVFRDMRDNPCLEIDKHEYVTLLPDNHPITCHLTGTQTMVSRIPDATFGLATFSDRDAVLPVWAPELHRERLEKLVLHPKYGLVSDPKILDIGLVFPFMVYEAKGWSGDCRDARRQACSAAAVYLDMLDELARRPGPKDSPRPYQTTTSHHYQVFVLTSFGAYWHLLVGYRRPRSVEEHAQKAGMSDTVYIFKTVWSSRVTDVKRAKSLLFLVHQIHLWAMTEFRTFVLEHLRAWHELCEKNYILEWDSKFDHSRQLKRKRGCDDAGDLTVPSWVAHLQESSRRLFQARAKASLEKAMESLMIIKGKGNADGESERSLTCMVDGCGIIFSESAVWLNHLRHEHNYEEREIAKVGWCVEEEEIRAKVKARQDDGIMATGRRWPDFIMPYPFRAPDLDDEKIFSMSSTKRRKLLAS